MLTVQQTAQRLGVVPEHVRRLVRAGELEAIKIGSAPNSHYRISEEALAGYIERSKAVPSKAAS